MLKEKRQYYVEDGGREFEFPKFCTLKPSEAIQHTEHIKSIFGFDDNKDVLDIHCQIEQVSSLISGVKADDVDFNFLDVLKSQNISPKREIFIDWHQFNKIDKISVKSFAEFFDDIWYPKADDIYLYDESFSWFVLIMHYGSISIYKIPQSDG